MIEELAVELVVDVGLRVSVVWWTSSVALEDSGCSTDWEV
jgi:hypothetical protein